MSYSYKMGPKYLRIADELRQEITEGIYPTGAQLPAETALLARWQVSLSTLRQAVGVLEAEGLIERKHGIGTFVQKPSDTKWQMTGRYARARAAQDLIFATDITGDVRKDTVRREWLPAPEPIAQLLNIEVGTRIFQRCSRTYINEIPTEDTSMFFPTNIVKAAPRLENEDHIQVVKFIEDAGYTVTRTANEIRARHASPSEQQLFGIDSHSIVIEHSHGTYDTKGEALEAVINIRPAQGNIITFETYEGPINNKEETR